MHSLGCSVCNNYCSGSKVYKLCLLIDHVELVRRRIDLDRELRFLNFSANHTVLQQLNRNSLALRVEDFHLLVALVDVVKHVVADKVQKMSHVAKWNNRFA